MMSFSASSSRSNRGDGDLQPVTSAACARNRSPICYARSSASPSPRWRGRTRPISRLCVGFCCAPRRPPSITRGRLSPASHDPTATRAAWSSRLPGKEGAMGAAEEIRVYLEIGRRRTFAGAVDWPGWCRSGRDEAGAVAAPPEARISITERLVGNATTDFGAPDGALPGDDTKVPDREIRRLQAILKACWRAFDTAADVAAGRTLSKGPRGGGRGLARIAPAGG